MTDPKSISSKRQSRGSALIVTLAIIALLTVVILSFFSFATGNLRVGSSSGDRKQAEVVAYSAGAYVESLFLQELATNLNSTFDLGTVGTTTNYFPKSPTNMVPVRLLGPSISASDTNYYNLIRQSLPVNDTNASSDNTSLAAANGRTIGIDRWNQVALIGGAGFTSTQLPDWIYLDRVKGTASASSTNTIGRFAYNVYDVGGLLNVNAAGYPGSIMSAQQASLVKGTPAGADLTQIPGVTASDVASLIAFRNASTASSGTNYILDAQAALRTGFLSAVFTNTAYTNQTIYQNNYFSSRQDLIRYAQTENLDLTNALPLLTTFSRSVNAPSWIPQSMPGSLMNYGNLAMTSGSTNRAVLDIRRSTATATLIHYHDDGTTTETNTVSVGDPLLPRRFSLAKLAWLTSQGPANGVSTAAIQSCFGLSWNAGSESWTYQDNPIKTLDQVAALSSPREPNFFELLKAGILAGSVGTASSRTTFDVGSPSPKQTYEANADLQTLRIGADIIDCAKTDDIPTTLTLGGVPVHGVEDLPYLYGMLNTSLFSASGGATSTETMNWCSLVLVPLLFNPNLAPATPPTAAPTNLRVIISSGTLTSIYLSSFYLNPSGSVNAMYVTPLRNLSSISSPPGTIPIVFSYSATDPYRSSVIPINNAISATTLNSLIPSAAVTPINAFLLYSYANNQTFDDTSKGCFRAVVQNLFIQLQYQSPYTQQWRTYDVLMGNEVNSYSGIGGAGGTTMDCYPAEYFIFPVNPRTSLVSPNSVLMKLDPRTSRFGVGYGEAYPSASSSMNPATSTPGLIARLPFGATGSISGNGVLPGLWAQGGTNNWTDASGTSVNVTNRDGIVRPADGWLGSSGTTPGPANLFAAANYANTSSPTRPQILHRPFQNVAELGYVFRDDPWKSLNFFDPSSGDGALLDLFAVTDEPLVGSGRVSLYTRQPKVLQTLLAGAAYDPTVTNSTTLTALAPAIASSLSGTNTSYIFNGSGAPQTTLPPNLAQLPSYIGSSALSTAFPTNASTIKYEREAVVRALAGSCQTRTWNLLIDVVAQAGSFPTATHTANTFVIAGEKHYWISIAIDRFSGKIIDQQMEPVDE